MYFINKVGWVGIKERKVLFDRKYSRTQFYIPGGVVYDGEKPEDAVVREVREELGVSLEPRTVKYFDIIEAQADGHPVGVVVKVRLFTGDYSGDMKPSNEIIELKWLTSADEIAVTPVGVLLLRLLKQKNLID
ncbi:MAG: NUDIX domain-containing protein [Patescibacteria group bacterium]